MTIFSCDDPIKDFYTLNLGLFIWNIGVTLY